MLLGFILLYLLVTLAIGFWASRRVKSSRDFALAGRRLPLFLAASALFATWFGSETIMGASSEFVKHGLIGVIEDPFGAALCLFLVGALFARPLYRLNILTFNDYFRIRYHPRVELLSAFLIVPSYFGWIAAQLVALAILLQVIAGISLPVGILICTTVVVIYTFVGGMWAVSITDFVQTIIIVVGLLVLTWQLNEAAGGWRQVLSAQPEGFFQFLPDRSAQGWLHYLAAWITIGLGSIPQQDVFQRTMAARNERTAVRASYLGGLLYLTVGLLPLYVGLCSKMVYPELHLLSDGQMILPQMVLQHSGMGMQLLFFGALLSAILSTTSGAILAPATVIGENIIKPYFLNITDRQLLQTMRIAVVGVALFSSVLALYEGNIYDLVATSSSFSLVSLFVPLAAGLYWKPATAYGAMASMLLGIVVWGGCEYIVTQTPSLLYGLFASALGMIVGSLLSQRWSD